MSDPDSKKVQVAHGQALSSRYPSGNGERGRGRERLGPSGNQANNVFPGSWLAVGCILNTKFPYFPSAYFCFLGGIRCGEIGGVMHGEASENLQTGNEFEHENRELLRLALPRRTYTESHMKYVQG